MLPKPLELRRYKLYMFTAFLLSLREWKIETENTLAHRTISVPSECNHNLQSAIINIYANTVGSRYSIILSVIWCNVRFHVSYMIDSHQMRQVGKKQSIDRWRMCLRLAVVVGFIALKCKWRHVNASPRSMAHAQSQHVPDYGKKTIQHFYDRNFVSVVLHTCTGIWCMGNWYSSPPPTITTGRYEISIFLHHEKTLQFFFFFK